MKSEENLKTDEQSKLLNFLRFLCLYQEDPNVASDCESCHDETKENVDLDAVQSLLAMSQWSPPRHERSPSPDSGVSSISRNSSSASLSSTTSVEDEPEKVRTFVLTKLATYCIRLLALLLILH